VHDGVNAPQLLFINTLAAKSTHKMHKYGVKEILMPFHKCHYKVKKQWCSVLHCHNPENHNVNVHCCEHFKSYKLGELQEEKIKSIISSYN
jgi:hypothetical protein